MEKEKLFQAVKLAGQGGFHFKHGISTYEVCRSFKLKHPYFSLQLEKKTLSDLLDDIKKEEKKHPSFMTLAKEFQTTEQIIEEKIYSYSGIYYLCNEKRKRE